MFDLKAHIDQLEKQLKLAQDMYEANRGTPRENLDLARVVAIEAQLEHLREGESA